MAEILYKDQRIFGQKIFGDNVRSIIENHTSEIGIYFTYPGCSRNVMMGSCPVFNILKDAKLIEGIDFTGWQRELTRGLILDWKARFLPLLA